MNKKIITEFDVSVPMRDGVNLNAIIVRPADDGKYPVLLCRMPYGKDAAISSGVNDVMIDIANTAKEGYVIVLQDTRGRFQSEGKWEVLSNMNREDEDGEDTVKWILEQPYSAGTIGTFGGSYLAFTQWCLMDKKIPGYKAAAPAVSFAAPRDGFWYRGGALELGLYTVWAMGLHSDTLMKMGFGEEQLLAAYGRMLYDLADLPEKMKFLPLRDYAPFVENQLPEAAMEIIRKGYEEIEDYKKLDISGEYESVNVPSLNIGGWYDIFLNGTLHNFMGVQEKASSEIAQNSKLVVGPWSHWSRNERLGDVYFGINGSAYGIDIAGMHKKWFDYFLKHEENGIKEQAPVKIFVMGENVWRDEQEWPLARTQYTSFYFGSHGHANTLKGDGFLETVQTDGAASDSYEYDPSNPVELLGGNNLVTPYYEAGPKDHRKIECREDVLVYTSGRLEQDTEVTGHVKAKLWIISSALDTDFVVRLLDVYPGGESMNIADGIIRARYRDFDKTGEIKFLEPGEPTLLDVDLWATSNVFKEGHRIRVEVTSSCFPRWDRNPNTGHNLQTDDERDFIVAKQIVLHNKEHASQIILPIIPKDSKD